ncbi:hypothetical protein I553_4372 [Mycobacterium xenopi 4042]|uniref:Uncharacterized protein n=1 Tax=Mycobacterium xenopi 4042 TaxID=1299334 RepID=X8AFZ7_MYCXE|nr:hypothetical protein I553_4372 [Mycobacterium xenopi 4042]
MDARGGGPDDLDRLLARLKRFRDEEGKTGPFEIHVISPKALPLTALNDWRTRVSPT